MNTIGNSIKNRLAENAIFRSFRYKNFRLFFTGQSISLIGTRIQRIATHWLVYHLTNSPFLLGLGGSVGIAGSIIYAQKLPLIKQQVKIIYLNHGFLK